MMGLLGWFGKEEPDSERTGNLPHKRAKLEAMVLELQEELPKDGSGQVRAYTKAARSLLRIGDVFGEYAAGAEARKTGEANLLQAGQLYDTATSAAEAARKEAARPDAGSGQQPLPIRLGLRVQGSGECPPEFLSAARQAVDAMNRQVSLDAEFAAAAGESSFAEAARLYNEAVACRQAAEAAETDERSFDRAEGESGRGSEEAIRQYWKALANYILVVQELEEPGITLNDRLTSGESAAIPETFVCKLDSDDPWKATSELAIREIKRAGEWGEAERRLRRFWSENGLISPVDREYAWAVEELLKQGEIREQAYWYRCPFQPVYTANRAGIRILGREVPLGYSVVYMFGEPGEDGELVVQDSFSGQSELLR